MKWVLQVYPLAFVAPLQKAVVVKEVKVCGGALPEMEVQRQSIVFLIAQMIVFIAKSTIRDTLIQSDVLKIS